MMLLGADSSNVFDRILDTAADNLRVAKILIQLGLDPNNVTYDAIFNRLFEIVLANINLANMFALIGAIFLVATLLTRTMVPLRIANIIGNVFFAGFGALAGDVRTLLLYVADGADQRAAFAADADTGEKGANRSARQPLDGMAEAVHDPAQVP